ncbi:MAG: MATE family efflux transporter [Tidjanibacter sp.]|nr:MATE family efflux transporter [Tidjanibacter sp.]MBQ6604441.1 MATE family efflux transporter [Tidjanibacter sp.]
MRKTYADLLRLALPVMLTQLGQVVVQLCDNMMVGRLGALPLAGVSFGGTVFFIIFALAIGFTLGLTPLVGELFAQNRKEEVAGYLQNSIALYLTMGVIFVALLLAAVPLMHYLGQPEEVVEVAIPYFRYLAWSVLPFMLFASFKQFLEGIGNTKVAMTIVVISNALNILLNWVFIFGKFGAPELGAAGAGLSTLIARAVTPVMMIAYFLSKREFRSYFDYFSWRKMMGLSREGNHYCKELFRVGLPIAGHLTLENSAFCITSLMMGWIGTVEIAANQITTTMANVAFMMVVGIGSATTILTSHAYGARDRAQIKAVSLASYTVGLAWNTITALSFILLRNHIPHLFTNDPEVVRTAGMLLIFCGLFQFSDGLQCISTGLLRGIKDVAVILRIALVAYVIINVPLGYLLCFVVGWGAPALWIGFIAGLTIAAVLLIRRFRRQLSSDDLFARAE